MDPSTLEWIHVGVRDMGEALAPKLEGFKAQQALWTQLQIWIRVK